MRLVIATHNQGKLLEFKALLSELSVEVLGCGELPQPCKDVEETGTTFAENALLKAQAVFDQTGLPAVADDSGLMVDFLGGAPGVYSKRFAPGSDADRNQVMLEKLLGVATEQRGAAFVSVLCLVQPDKPPQFFEGKVEGSIAQEPRGEFGFGYDPLFIPIGFQETFGKLGQEVKNTISHRARALEKLRDYLVRQST
jgi:XTP/dITP diphosphohydrolase